MKRVVEIPNKKKTIQNGSKLLNFEGGQNLNFKDLNDYWPFRFFSEKKSSQTAIQKLHDSSNYNNILHCMTKSISIIIIIHCAYVAYFIGHIYPLVGWFWINSGLYLFFFYFLIKIQMI